MKKWFSNLTPAAKGAIAAACIIAIATIIAAYLQGLATLERAISATQTGEAKSTALASAFTRTPIVTPSSTVTPSPTLMPTTIITETLTPTSTPSEPVLPDGYTMYDNFDGKLTNGWEITTDSTLCKREIVDYGLKAECTGSATEHVGFTMLPASPSANSVQGIAIAFYTLPVQPDYTQWGKYQLQLRFGSECNSFDKMYQISIRPSELSFLEYGSGMKLLNSPVPTQIITPYQTQVVRIEYSNNQTDFYVNDVGILKLAVPPSTPSICVLFQSSDNNKMTLNGYRGIVILWFATK